MQLYQLEELDEPMCNAPECDDPLHFVGVSFAGELLTVLRQAELAIQELCIDQHPDNECWNVLARLREAIAAGEKVG